MKKRILYSIVVLISGSAVISCSKEWLKPEPLSFYAPENLLINKEGFESMLVTARKNLRNSFYGELNTVVSESIFTELGVAGPLNDNGIRNMNLQLTPNADGNYYVLDNFQWAYRPIRVVNSLVSRIDDITWSSEQDRNEILAEAYFHRAYWYYLLVNQFGDVPYIDKELLEAKLDFFTHSRWTILDRMQQEMEFAVQWLPEQMRQGVPSRSAGKHLLTKIYLANRAYEKAVDMAADVIAKHPLMRERFGPEVEAAPSRNLFWDLHRPVNVHNAANTETILGVLDRNDLPDEVRTGGLHTMRNYHPAWWNARVLDSRAARGTLDRGATYDSLGRGNSNLRPSNYYLYEVWKDDNDLRRKDGNWVLQEELLYNNPASRDFGKPIDPRNFAAIVDTFQHYHSFPFYKTFVPQATTDQPPNGGQGDYYVYRSAETYLLRAEAYYWLGRMDLSAADLNSIRRRADAGEIAAGDVTIEFILDERARELFAEEHRKSELVRISYIMAAEGRNGYSLDEFSERNFWYDRVMATNNFYKEHLRWGSSECRISPYHVLFPIPADAINTNTLGIINQNKGYAGAERNLPPLTEIDH
ncbi:RagB/SusD family nutrient uptake outer membrane protein [Sphingobacterium pedocola]|uniref:RagB/SusD family nutrient uptake outer membrane protein n=1 Tax=Sphingobacterium pedocola TaxID=2082722 RepID=A0ABR9T738_9SPHI|nr:RagB/SusD family nutrient uptake outer membrane protein [Sphingobacterium pedocola]MBE8721146.1 RagB/SusD family nutrient uptake outer membrane protein [Sphingobacterium pedocola]